MTKPVQDFKIRFGSFELDLQSGELRKGHTRVRLQNQPLKVLIALLNKPGEVVSREELREELWPSDTFGDFEHGLRVAVNKLRQALNDDPDKPRYVETLPTRGYRFIFPITPPASEPVGSNGDIPRALAEPIRKTSRFPRAAIVVGCIALLGAASFSWFLSRGKTNLTEKDRIVLADFTNTTGNAVFDGTLRQGLSAQLEQSPFLNTTTDQKIRETLQLMGQKPDANLTPEIAREVCQRTSSTAVLQGSIAKIGTEYLLALKAVNCWNGDLLASTEVRASDKNRVLTSLDSAASEIRRHLGESSASISKYDIPLVQVTTPSLEALKLFSLYARGGGRIPPEPILQRAVELDLTLQPLMTNCRTVLLMPEKVSWRPNMLKKHLTFAIESANGSALLSALHTTRQLSVIRNKSCAVRSCYSNSIPEIGRPGTTPQARAVRLEITFMP